MAGDAITWSDFEPLARHFRNRRQANLRFVAFDNLGANRGYFKSQCGLFSLWTVLHAPYERHGVEIVDCADAEGRICVLQILFYLNAFN